MERPAGSFIVDADGSLQPNLSDQAMAGRKKIADEEKAKGNQAHTTVAAAASEQAEVPAAKGKGKKEGVIDEQK